MVDYRWKSKRFNRLLKNSIEAAALSMFFKTVKKQEVFARLL